MAVVIEAEGYRFDEYKLMGVRIKGRGGVDARLILPSTSWNTSGGFLLHDLSTGSIKPVESIVDLLKQEGQFENCLVKE